MEDHRNIIRSTLDDIRIPLLDRGDVSSGTFTTISITDLTSTYYVPSLISDAGECPITILITSLEPGYLLRKSIFASVRKADEGFVASFTEANIHASGDSIDEAGLNLKSLITDVFDLLRDHALNTLGPEPRRQRVVLSSYIVKT